MYLQGTDLRKEALCPVIFLYNEKENNDMKVIGFRKSSFKGDDGQEVSGVNLFLTEKCEKGEGLSCDRIYVMDRILAASGYTPKLGDEVIIEWNRWGKCSGIKTAIRMMTAIFTSVLISQIIIPGTSAINMIFSPLEVFL